MSYSNINPNYPPLPATRNPAPMESAHGVLAEEGVTEIAHKHFRQATDSVGKRSRSPEKERFGSKHKKQRTEYAVEHSSLQGSFFPLNETCTFRILTLLDTSDLLSMAQVSRQANRFVKEVIRIIGNKIFSQRFRLQHDDSLSTIQSELSCVKSELDHLAKADLAEYGIDSERIKQMITHDRLGTRRVRESIHNLSNLPIEDMIRMLASEVFYKAYGRVLNALAICCLNQTNKTFFQSEELVTKSKCALIYAHYYNQPHVVRFLLRCNVDFGTSEHQDNILHLIAIKTDADPSLIQVSIEEAAHNHAKLKQLIEAENQDGNTPLLLSINNEHAFRCLIEAGANPLHRNHLGQTIVHLATKKGELSFFKLVLEQLTGLGFKQSDFLEKTDNKKLTPLFYTTNFKVENAKEKIKLFISMGAAIQDTDGATILHHASKNECVSSELLLFIISLKPELIHEKDNFGRTPIFYASNSSRKFDILISQGADIRLQDHSGNTLLHHVGDNKTALEDLFFYGFEVNLQNLEGLTPIFYALNHPQNFQLLLSKGANPYHKDKHGGSLLHQWAFTGSSDAVLQQLLSLGLSLEEEDHSGHTPLFYALNNSQNFQLLLDKRANIHHKTNDGQSLMHHSAEIVSSTTLIQKLINLGFNLEEQDHDGYTPIFYALNNPQNFQFLLEKGANAFHQGKDGATLLHLAAAESPPIVLQKLLDLGLNLEEQNHIGETPFFCSLESPQNFQLFLDQGANLYHQTNEGKTIFDLAKDLANPLINELLVKYQSP
ncbi:MAG: ankyrin repeat domain-containing protein [Parachlamydiaceae bacterium]